MGTLNPMPMVIGPSPMNRLGQQQTGAHKKSRDTAIGCGF
jgi:hypothetical protein